jgi:hypothetical protein
MFERLPSVPFKEGRIEARLLRKGKVHDEP